MTIPNLSTFKELTQGKRTLLLVNIAAAVGVIGLIIALVLPLQGGPDKPNLPVTDRAAEKVTVRYNGPKELPATQLPLYRLQSLTPASQLLPTFASILQFKVNPQVSTVYQSEDKKALLTQQPGALFAVYSNQAAAVDPAIPLIVTKDQAQKNAQEFLEALGYDISQLKQNERLTRFTRPSRSAEGLDDVSADQTSIIVLVYERHLEGYPVSFSTAPLQAVEVWISAKGVYKAQLPSLSFTAEKGRLTELLPLPVILSQLEAGYFYILGSLSAVANDPAQLEVTGLTLDTATLEYRIDEGQRLILPFVQMSGTATLRNGQTVEVALTTPAVSTKE